MPCRVTFQLSKMQLYGLIHLPSKFHKSIVSVDPHSLCQGYTKSKDGNLIVDVYPTESLLFDCPSNDLRHSFIGYTGQ